MKLKRKQAFTLMELLIVVIVLGILAGIAVPKYARVLETRKTGEAEEVLSAVRTEQEKRCIMGKSYLDESARGRLASLSSVHSTNYNYELKDGKVEASRPGKGYTLKMWYKTGSFCCEGAGCEKLNKDYPPCETEIVDECIEVPEPMEPKEPDPDPEPGCEDYSYASANVDECCAPEYEHLWPSLCSKPVKTCSDNEYFMENVKECCEQGTDRDECFDYEWKVTRTQGGKCGSVKCTPLTGCLTIFVKNKCLKQYCEHKSGTKLLKENGYTNDFSFWNGWFDGAFGDSEYGGSPTGLLGTSYLTDMPCNRANLGKTSTYFCNGAVDHRTSGGTLSTEGGYEGYLYWVHDLYDATFEQKCTRTRKTSF